MEERDIIASNITFYRKKLGLSQLELAEKLQYSNKNISKWEKGETTPSVFTLKKLAFIFGISLDELTIPADQLGKTTSVEHDPIIPIKKGITFTVKLLYLLMANAILILCAFIAIFILDQLGVKNFNKWLILIYITPLMALSAFIFVACIRKRVDVISISIFVWLSAFSVFITFIKRPNIWFVFVIAGAVEFLIVCIMYIINLNIINRVRYRMFISKQNQKNPTPTNTQETSENNDSTKNISD